MSVQFDLSSFNEAIQDKLDSITGETDSIVMMTTIKGIESAFSTILDGTAINNANAIEDIGNDKIEEINGVASGQIDAIILEGETQVQAVTDVATGFLDDIDTNGTSVLSDIEQARIDATNSVSGASAGTNPFLLMGA
jgi:hypothetical protein